MAFDLGVAFNIGSLSQGNELEKLTQAILQAVNDTAPAWSVDNALNYSAKLPNVTNPAFPNDQVSALRDFLSLYALTRTDAISGNGTWDDLPVKNGAAVRAALFGDGTAASGLIAKVLIGGKVTSSQNSYPNMRKVLDGLGISNSTSKAHHNHFHIYLRPSAVVAIATAQHLLADAQPDPLAQTTTPTLQTAAQGLLDYAQNIITGEELMFTMDVPSVPAQQTPIALVQAATTSSTPQPNYILKVCGELSNNDGSITAENGVEPAGWLALELSRRNNRDIINNPTALASIRTTLLEAPKHGSLISPAGKLYYMYHPEPDYLGKDKAIFMAEFEGKHYKIVVELRVLLATGNVSSCPPPKLIKVNGKPVSGASDYNLGNITVTFADLAGGALGQTTGLTITLDTTASGNGWFIDTTPSDNSEYLPTSNPFEWVAKAGSAAAGKIDMLTVLLHEYGHALGIDHNPDAHDYMGTTLTAGVRRLPTADEMALMQQLIAQAKNGLIAQQSTTTDLPSNVPAPFPTLPLGGMGIAFAGLLQRNRYGGLNAVLNNSTLTQYDVAANATLTNGSLNNGNGWATQGSVNIGNGVATLNEISTTQTRLSQVFMVNANDRYLSFTLSGTALDNRVQ